MAKTGAWGKHLGWGGKKRSCNTKKKVEDDKKIKERKMGDKGNCARLRWKRKNIKKDPRRKGTIRNYHEWKGNEWFTWYKERK